MAQDRLVARGVEVAYRGKPRLNGERVAGVKVLHGVDLRIGRGETVGIVGELGSGKTTLGRALLRLTDIDAGSIAFDGQDISRLRESQMRPLRRMIFQVPMTSLNPRHTIRRILVEPLLFHRVARGSADAERRVREFFDRVALPLSCLDRTPHELSGGQRQRVGIARAALLEPDFVLADEIVSGLDVSTQAQALNLLKTPGGTSAMRLLRSAGIAAAILTGESMDGDYWIRSVPNLSNFCVVNYGSKYGDDPNADVNAFFKRFEAKSGKKADISYGLRGYSAVQAWAKAAVNAAGSLDSDKVAAKLDTFDEARHVR